MFSLIRNVKRRLSTGVDAAFVDAAINKYAAQEIRPVTLKTLLQFGTPPWTPEKLIQSAHYAQTELPVRLARRIQAFQRLPFIVCTNPHIREVHGTYYESFETLKEFPVVRTADDDTKLTEKLVELTERHKDNIPKLAQGFLESHAYLSTRQVTKFLDDLITSRIGIRLIAEHHVAFHNPQADYIGVLHTRLRPAGLLQHVGAYVQELCEINYGSAPKLVIDGQVDTLFQYIPVHLEYIICELFKNSFRATVEHSKRIGRTEHPDIQVTITQGGEEVGIRIRDQGGGIDVADVSKIFEYSYTTVKKEPDEEASEASNQSVFTVQTQMALQAGVGGPMAGLGYGLPMAQIYAKYFGGSLELISLYGYGCDVFLTLKNIGSLQEDVVI